MTLSLSAPDSDAVRGETRAEAVTRAGLVRVHAYQVDLDLTGAAGLPHFTSTVTVRFSCAAPGAATFVELGAALPVGATLNGARLDPAAQLAVDHIKCHQLYSGQAAAPDPLLISKAWQNERGWALEIPPSAAAYDLQLLEVRRCGTTEGLNAHILYKWHGNPLSLYVMNRESKRASSEAQFVTKAGQDAVIWTDGGRTYAVVGEASPRELNKIVDYVKLTAHSRW